MGDVARVVLFPLCLAVLGLWALDGVLKMRARLASFGGFIVRLVCADAAHNAWECENAVRSALEARGVAVISPHVEDPETLQRDPPPHATLQVLLGNMELCSHPRNPGASWPFQVVLSHPLSEGTLIAQRTVFVPTRENPWRAIARDVISLLAPVRDKEGNPHSLDLQDLD